jgi:hypothetical protein
MQLFRSRWFLGLLAIFLFAAVADQALAQYSNGDGCAVEQQAGGQTQHDESNCSCACHQVVATLPVALASVQKPLRLLNDIVDLRIDLAEALPMPIDHPPQLG